MIILFYLILFLLFYHFFGYALLLNLFSDYKRVTPNVNPGIEPKITVICPAYNEESTIREKLLSFTELDYPAEKIGLIVISDGSQDSTESIVREFESSYNNIRLIVQTPQQGKPSTHNLIESSLNTDWILATDANSIFEKRSVRELVKYCEDDNIGMIVGKLIYRKGEKEAGEITYWNFESKLKELETEFNTLICANGSIYLIRKEYFTRIHPASVDDFERTLIVLEKGKKAVYTKKAKVSEFVTDNLPELIKKKIRIISREWFALFRHLRLLNPIKHPLITFQLFSHKIIRWLLPFFSFLLILTSYNLKPDPVFEIFFYFQILFYALGLYGIIFFRTVKSKLITICSYWLAMNVASLVGFFYFLIGKQIKSWETER